jgi:hypothetical protein
MGFCKTHDVTRLTPCLQHQVSPVGMSIRLVVNSMPMLKRNPLRLHKLHFKRFHFNIGFFKEACCTCNGWITYSCLRTLALPGQNSFFCAKILWTGRTSSAAVAFNRRACRQPSTNFPVPSKFGHSVRTLRSHTCLIFPFVRSGNLARKTVLPAKKLKRLQQKGK